MHPREVALAVFWSTDFSDSVDILSEVLFPHVRSARKELIEKYLVISKNGKDVLYH